MRIVVRTMLAKFLTLTGAGVLMSAVAGFLGSMFSLGFMATLGLVVCAMLVFAAGCRLAPRDRVRERAHIPQGRRRGRDSLLRGCAVLLLAMGVFGLFCLGETGFGRVPLPIAEDVPARMPRLVAGMTEAQVLAALRLTGYTGAVVGNGQSNNYDLAYPLRPGMSLQLFFDMRREPAR